LYTDRLLETDIRRGTGIFAAGHWRRFISNIDISTLVVYHLCEVPVIAIFTKYDSVVDKAYSQLRKNKMGRLEAKQQAPGHARRLFRRDLRVMLHGINYESYVCLSSNHLGRDFHYSVSVLMSDFTDMHREDSSCSELTSHTAKAMKNDILVQFFVSVQQNNVNVCIQHAIQ
jgi:hypothetical protein